MTKIILYLHLLIISFAGVQVHRTVYKKDYTYPVKDTVVVTDSSLYIQLKKVWKEFPLPNVKEPVIVLRK